MAEIEIKEVGSSVKAMGLMTNYHDYGDGAPVVLLHGSGPGVSAWANWRLTIPAMADQFRVIAPDIAGYGWTDLDADAGYTMDYWVRHLEKFLDALGLEKVSFVGNSFGGVLATSFAVKNPHRVDRLVLMGANCLSYSLPEALDHVWGYDPSIDNMRKLLNWFVHNKSLISEEVVEARHALTTRSAYADAYKAMFPAPRQKILDSWAIDESDLSALDVKVLILHGREDAFVPIDVSYRLFNLIPKSQLHLFGHCGHWVQGEKPEEFNELIKSFLNKK